MIEQDEYSEDSSYSNADSCWESIEDILERHFRETGDADDLESINVDWDEIMHDMDDFYDDTEDDDVEIDGESEGEYQNVHYIGPDNDTDYTDSGLETDFQDSENYDYEDY